MVFNHTVYRNFNAFSQQIFVVVLAVMVASVNNRYNYYLVTLKYKIKFLNYDSNKDVARLTVKLRLQL